MQENKPPPYICIYLYLPELNKPMKWNGHNVLQKYGECGKFLAVYFTKKRVKKDLGLNGGKLNV